MDTTASLRCARCGSALLGAVTPGAVVTLEGRSVPFRRNTDYIVCSCFASYPVSDLRRARDQVEARTRW